MISIKPEYSTQPCAQLPNPMVRRAIDYLHASQDASEQIKIADQGCGALRHLRVLLKSYDHITLVDTKLQLSRKHTLDGIQRTIPEYIDSLELRNKDVLIMDNTEFLASRLDLNAIFNICTFDVVIPETRIEMLEAARQNLKDGGNFILIIPRNDSSIICRCKDDNKLSDGHYFKRYGAFTFYTNFRKYDDLLDIMAALGFTLVKDLSIFRQVCLIMAIAK